MRCEEPFCENQACMFEGMKYTVCKKHLFEIHPLLKPDFDKVVYNE